MNILILEDEIYNFHLLRHMLEEMGENYCVTGPVASVKYAIDYLQMHKDIDIIIADIQLNDGLSFDALKYAPENVPVIFTTAYDQHALKAFEYNSLSYLLKPIDEDELREALRKAKRLGEGAANALKVYRKRFIVKTGLGERVILLDSVRYILSENKTTYIKLLDGSSYPIDISLETVATQLDPRQFMRVNRKYIVPLINVSGTLTLMGGKEQLLLKGNDYPEIIVSRDRKNKVNSWLES